MLKVKASQSETEGFPEDWRGKKVKFVSPKAKSCKLWQSHNAITKTANKQVLGKQMTPALEELKENLHGPGIIYGFMMYEELS